MREAIQSVRGVEITRAVRDSTADDREIKTGNIIAIVDDHIVQVGDAHLPVIEGVLAGASPAPGLVTVYRGGDVSGEDADRLVADLRERHPAMEFVVQIGGQEHSPPDLALE